MSQQSSKAALTAHERTIYYIWDYLEWGGVYIYFLSLMKHARRSSWAVKAVLPAQSADRLFDDLSKYGIEAITFPAHTDIGGASTLKRKLERRWRKTKSELVMLRAMNRLDLRRSVLHLDVSPYHSFWAVLYLALRSRVVQTFHTPLVKVSPLRKFVWQLKMGFLTRLKSYRVLASNESVKESMREYVSPRAFERIEIAYSGINLEEIQTVYQDKPDRAAVAQQLNLPPENLWVATIAQFIERKGCWTLLEAAQKILQEEPGITFIWLGTTEPDAETRRQIESYGLGDAFRLLAPADFGGTRQNLLTLAAQADVFALPSQLEGLPIALCEAMGLKLAAVASNVGAIGEAIEDHQTGLLIEPGNSEQLAAAILELKRSPALREKLASAGQRKAFEKFGDEKAAAVTLRAYEEIWRC